ncbi:hypothetical protein B0H10DRAFT_639939 [Mycena sp. CBHHK59/15]|nr:hypothetical protein B0H10DRAFT_639939 [Mycena sp. CBHHK59/15]
MREDRKPGPKSSPSIRPGTVPSSYSGWVTSAPPSLFLECWQIPRGHYSCSRSPRVGQHIPFDCRARRSRWLWRKTHQCVNVVYDTYLPQPLPPPFQIRSQSLISWEDISVTMISLLRIRCNDAPLECFHIPAACVPRRAALYGAGRGKSTVRRDRHPHSARSGARSGGFDVFSCFDAQRIPIRLPFPPSRVYIHGRPQVRKLERPPRVNSATP